MKLPFLAAGLLACGLAGAIPVSRSEEKPAPFSLSYAYAGLTEITVKDGKLRYVWHTRRQREGGGTPDRSSLEEYDRHQIDVWLTDRELERFRDWVGRHKVFDLDKDYPSASGGNSRGAAY